MLSNHVEVFCTSQASMGMRPNLCPCPYRKNSKKRWLLYIIYVSLAVSLLWIIKENSMDGFYWQRFVAGIIHKMKGNTVLRLQDTDGDLGANGTCIVPVIDPFRPGVKSKTKYKYKCYGKRKFLFRDGKYYISESDLGDGDITMQYIRRVNDNEFEYSHAVPVKTLLSKGSEGEWFFTPAEDFVLIKGPGKHIEHHANAVPNKELESKLKKLQDSNLHNLKVVMVVIESQSAAGFRRHGRKILNTLEGLKNSYFFKGHGIVGDGTTAQMCAILTGVSEFVLPESRKSFKGARPVDRWPFIFKTYHSKGYVTLYHEDQAEYASFNYRLMGFTDPPSSHYPRPFFLSAVKRKTKNFCFDQVPSHIYSLEYAKSFLDAYPNLPSFSFVNIAHCCHDDFNSLKAIDADLANFVHYLQKKDYLSNTALFILGDHGHRQTPFRTTVEGKLEERLPFLSITLPPWFKKKFPDFDAALKHNGDILTSHFDLHATLQHLIALPNAAPWQQTGQSLFTKIDFETRSCRSAGIPDHYCPCLEYEEVDVKSKEVSILSEVVVKEINNIVSKVDEAKESCQKLVLKEIIRAGKRRANWKVEKFVQTLSNDDCDSCKLVFQETTGKSWAARYELIIKVAPSGGLYEASVSMKGGQFMVDSVISRLDRYGDQPKCVASKYPHLRKYCYCKDYVRAQ